MRTKKLETITCPKCGREYLPAEIYIPTDFFGSPKAIMRDENGKIEHFIGNSINEKEVYICDKCNCNFNITAKISFSTKEVDDFEEESTTIISHGLDFNEE